jgi:hypothetical protein
VGNKWGYIDHNGKVVIDLKYEYASPFKDGIAAVGYQGKYVYIKPDGSILGPKL